MDAAGYGWFRGFLPFSPTVDAKGVLGLKDNQPVAGVVFCNACPHSVEVHQVIQDPFIIRHNWFEVIAEAGFGTTRRTMYSLVSADNHKVLKFDAKLNFKEAGRIPEAFGEGVDGVVLALKRGDCQFLKENKDG